MILSLARFPLGLDAGQSNPSNEVALGRKKDDQERQYRNDGNRHYLVDIDETAALHHSQTESQRVLVDVAQINERALEIVPVCDEGEDCHCGQSRLGQGQQNPEENTETVTAVHAGRIIQFIGDGGEELAHQEYEERPAKPGGQHQGQESIYPAKP